MKRVEWIGCCLLALSVGCSTVDDELPENHIANMELLSVSVPEKEVTRAEVTSITKVKVYATNQTGMGPYVAGNTGDVYEYKNGQWQLDPALPLTSTLASVYAISPETAAITPSSDATAGSIAVNILTEDKFIQGDQTDYLYATPVTDISSTKKSVSLVMNHSLSKVSFRVEKSQAAESDVITLKKLEVVSGTNRLQAGSGRMELATGLLGGLTDRGSLVLKGTLPLAFPQATPNITALVAPMSAAESVLSFVVTVDIAGKERTFSTQVLPTAQLWKAGEHYLYHILVNKIGVTLSGVTINKWGSDANQDTSIGI